MAEGRQRRTVLTVVSSSNLITYSIIYVAIVYGMLTPKLLCCCLC